MTDTTKLVAQLRALSHLTQTEVQIAELRVGQARTDAIRRELEQNAENARERHRLLLDAIRDLGGVPDVITPALGRLTAWLKSTVEQTEPLDEALLQDLALEHHLLDRARYLKILAETAEEAKVRRLAERLIDAHSATVDWLTVVLAEEALGGPAALRATPIQRVAGGATRVLNLPARIAADRVNRVVETGRQTGGHARTKLAAAADKATQLTGAARDVVTAGRNASLQRTETVATRSGDAKTARSVHAARREAGALSVAELPVRNYDALNAQDAIKGIKGLKEVVDIRAVLRYEENNANRSSVIAAAEAQIAAVAKEASGLS